jgi:hypothetical protein
MVSAEERKKSEYIAENLDRFFFGIVDRVYQNMEFDCVIQRHRNNRVESNRRTCLIRFYSKPENFCLAQKNTIAQRCNKFINNQNNKTESMTT